MWFCFVPQYWLLTAANRELLNEARKIKAVPVKVDRNQLENIVIFYVADMAVIVERHKPCKFIADLFYDITV